MQRPVKAARYAAGAQPWIVEAITSGRLHCFDFYDACKFYKRVLRDMRGTNDLALLAANDRFFLLTVILHRKDALHPWLYERCREVEAEPYGHLDLWARYHYKSTIITFAGIIQGIIEDPEKSNCIFSGTNKIAKPFLLQIKQELETNEKLHVNFSDVFYENPRKEAPRWSLETGIVVKRRGNPKEGTVEAYGMVDGMPTGRHFNRLWFDDLITQEHVTNPEMIAKVTERWELADNLGVGEGTEIATVGTRYSFADTYGIMLERGVFSPRIYPATDNGKLNGSPVFLSAAHWEAVKNKQRSTVAAQMLQNPTAGKETVFMPQWLSRWEVRPAQLSVYIMCDPSGGRTRKSDRTAIAVVGVDGRGNKFFLDGFRHRMTLSERWLAMKQMWKKWSNEKGVVHCGVGYEKYGMQSDLEYFEERMREEQIYFEVKEINWPREGDHSKRARVERLEPDVRNGRFFLPAVIYEPGKGDCYWHIDENTSNVVKPAAKGLTKAMKQMADTGHEFLIAKALRRRDEDGKPYDVTMALMEEMLFFPYAPKDDLVDATSRIFDMEVIIPSVFEEKEANYINSLDYPDA